MKMALHSKSDNEKVGFVTFEDHNDNDDAGAVFYLSNFVKQRKNNCRVCDTIAKIMSKIEEC